MSNPRTTTYTLTKDDVGMSTIMGKIKRSQEDVLKASYLPHFDELSEAMREDVLRKTFYEMQNKYGSETEEGSTGCAVVAWLNDENVFHANTVNIGDSTAYVIIINAEGDLTFAKRLNEVIHDPKHERVAAKEKHPKMEAIRLKLGDASYDKRMEKLQSNRIIKEEVVEGKIQKSSLGPSRVFGDMDFSAKLDDAQYTGILREPDTYSDVIPLEKDDRVFVIVASDGLTENNFKYESYDFSNVPSEIQIAVVVKDAVKKGQSCASIAETLRDIARVSCSFDDISVGTFKVTKNKTSAAIFDGHGGHILSSSIGDAFYAALNVNLYTILENDQTNLESSAEKTVENNLSKLSIWNAASSSSTLTDTPFFQKTSPVKHDVIPDKLQKLLCPDDGFVGIRLHFESKYQTANFLLRLFNKTSSCRLQQRKGLEFSYSDCIIELSHNDMNSFSCSGQDGLGNFLLKELNKVVPIEKIPHQEYIDEGSFAHIDEDALPERFKTTSSVSTSVFPIAHR